MEIRTDVSQLTEAVTSIKTEIAKVIVGQEQMIELLIAAILADGHVLIEGVPGVAKTLTAKLLARCINVPFSRIQFTPDLMPSDVIGTSVFNPQTATFSFKYGPVFSNIVLIDEINRSPAKTQAALFEVMEEKQITYDGVTYPIPQPFMVLATQNPVEHEGTYRLPEAQLDRFLMKVVIGYPSQLEEREIMDRQTIGGIPQVRRVASPKAVLDARAAVKQIHMEDSLKDYVVRIVFATREPEQFGLIELKPMIAYGVSPRASIFISLAARANAFLERRAYVLPDDVKAVAPDV